MTHWKLLTPDQQNKIKGALFFVLAAIIILAMVLLEVIPNNDHNLIKLTFLTSSLFLTIIAVICLHIVMKKYLFEEDWQKDILRKVTLNGDLINNLEKTLLDKIESESFFIQDVAAKAAGKELIRIDDKVFIFPRKIYDVLDMDLEKTTLSKEVQDLLYYLGFEKVIELVDFQKIVENLKGQDKGPVAKKEIKLFLQKNELFEKDFSEIGVFVGFA